MIQKKLRVDGKIQLNNNVLIEYAGEGGLIRAGDAYLYEVDGEKPRILTARKTDFDKTRAGVIFGKVFSKEAPDTPNNVEDCVRVRVQEIK